MSETEHHYVHCGHCGRQQKEWSVIVDSVGRVEQVECKRCGGTEWVRGQEADHV